MFAFWPIFLWQDYIEIFFLSVGIYGLSLWLIQDKRKNLLAPLYVYCSLIIISSLYHLAMVNTLLISFSPAALIIFMMLHQETLQRNFITLKNKLPLQKNDSTTSWIESLIRSCLISFNNNKEIIGIIENNDAIADYLQTSFIIETPIHKGILDLLIESSLFDSNKYLWLRSNGILVGINCFWNVPQSNETQRSTNSTIPLWKQEALLMTQKTDVFVFKASYKERLFEVIVQGKQYDQLTTNGFIALLNKYYKVTSTHNAGIQYDVKSKQTVKNQSHS